MAEYNDSNHLTEKQFQSIDENKVDDMSNIMFVQQGIYKIHYIQNNDISMNQLLNFTRSFQQLQQMKYTWNLT